MQPSLFSVAQDLVTQGFSLAEVRVRLLDQGFSEREVDLVLRHFSTARPATPDSPAEGRGPFADAVRTGLLIGGGLVAAVGTLLFIGNVTGAMRTVPMAGFLLMGLGGWLVTKGFRL